MFVIDAQGGVGGGGGGKCSGFDYDYIVPCGGAGIRFMFMSMNDSWI